MNDRRTERSPQALIARGSLLRSLGIVGVLVIACAPIVVDGATRLADHWAPVGDDAMIAFRSYDVLSRNSPLHGMPSTLHQGGSDTVYHPGPMLFWVYAGPERLTHGASWSIVITVLILQLAAVGTIALLVRRQLGLTGALCALMLITVVEFALGRDVVASMLNLYVVLLPFGAFLVAAWAAASGDARGLPAWAFFGSLAALSHVVFVPIVGVVSVAAIGAYVDSVNSGRVSSERRRTYEWVALGIVVAAWIPIIYDTVAHYPGNFLRLLGDTGAGDHPGVSASFSAVVRIVGQVGLWPTAVGGRHNDLYADLRWWEIAAAAAAVTVLVLAVRARRDAVVRNAVVGIALTLAATMWVLNRLPSATAQFDVETGARDRLVYVIGACYAGVLVLAGSVVVGRFMRVPHPTSSWRTGGLVVLVIAALAFTTAGSVRRSPDDTFIPAFNDPVVQASSRQLLAGRPYLDRRATYVMVAEGFSFSEAKAVEWQLYRRGYDIRVPASDPYLGDRHRAPSSGPTATLHLVRSTFAPEPGWQWLGASESGYTLYVEPA